MLVYHVTAIVHLSVVSSGLKSLKGSFTCAGATAVFRAVDILSVFRISVFQLGCSVPIVTVCSCSAWSVTLVQLLTLFASLQL